MVHKEQRRAPDYVDANGNSAEQPTTRKPMNDQMQTTIETALALVKTVERGEPFIFEAAEGDFLIFRCGGGSIGVISTEDAAKIARADSAGD